MYFTSTHLLTLSDEGTYRLYDLSDPQSFNQYTLGSEVSEMGVVSAQAHDDGFVFLTGGLQFMEVRGWRGGRATPLAHSGLNEPPHAWILVPPDQSTSGHVEIVICTSNTVIVLDALERVDQRVTRGPFSHIRLSPNGRFLALITTIGVLWVVSVDFGRSLSEVDISDVAADSLTATGRPDKAEWCGDNALVLVWGGKAVVVGPSGDRLRWVRFAVWDLTAAQL